MYGTVLFVGMLGGILSGSEEPSRREFLRSTGRVVGASVLLRTAIVAIACRNFIKLCNNNEPLLRCLHSIPSPIEKLLPGQSAHQEGVLLFFDGGHEELRAHFEKLTSPRWAQEGK